MISVPKESPASSGARWSGSACFGNTDRRLYRRLSQSFTVHGIGPVARRHRSRSVSARSR
jgi:hypothetical protein